MRKLKETLYASSYSSLGKLITAYGTTKVPNAELYWRPKDGSGDWKPLVTETDFSVNKQYKLEIYEDEPRLMTPEEWHKQLDFRRPVYMRLQHSKAFAVVTRFHVDAFIEGGQTLTAHTLANSCWGQTNDLGEIIWRDFYATA